MKHSALIALCILSVAACAPGGNPGDDLQQPPPTGGGTTPGTGTGNGTDPGTGGGTGTTDPGTGDPGTVTPPPPPVTYLREWAVSPSGSDTAAGTATAPFRTISRAIKAVGAGDRITVKPGTYRERVRISGTGIAAGTATAPIRLQGEPGAKLAPGSESGTLLMIERPYWQVDGFEVDVEGKNYFAASMSYDVTGSVLSNSHLHHGSLGAGITTNNGANGGTIANNHIHHFIWPGNDSHGIHVQPGSKNITIRKNVLHDNSGDSVQCEGYDVNTQADGILIEGNEMYSDLEQAVDIKTCKNVRIIGNKMRDYMYTSFPDGTSMVIHYDASNVTVEKNEFINIGKAISLGGNAAGIVIRGNKFRNMAVGTQLLGLGVNVDTAGGTQILNNTFLYADVAAVRVASGGRNVTVKNNLFIPRGTGLAISASSSASGFVSNSNLFQTGSRFSAGSLSSWQALGRDKNSREADTQLNIDTMVPGPAAVDWGERLGQPFCGAGPDVGAVETGC